MKIDYSKGMANSKPSHYNFALALLVLPYCVIIERKTFMMI